MDYAIQYFEKIDSTNTYLYRLALQGEPEYSVVFADEQTAGKGRRGRSFLSPKGNVYMSFVIRPNRPIDTLHLITPMVAVAVQEAIEELFQISCGIKWVNDLYYNKRKVCGILTEVHPMEDGTAEFCIIGIGINLCNDDSLKELNHKAGSILTLNSVDLEIRKALCIKIMDRFRLYYENDSMDFMNRYRDYSILIGKEVTYITQSESRTVKVVNINNNGELVVDDHGEIFSYYDGEIQLKNF